MKSKKNCDKIRTELNYKEDNRKIIIIIKILIMINLIIQILSINKIYLIEYRYSNVTLKIKRTGNKNVYDTSYFKEFPNEVYIKGNKQNDIKPQYNFCR